jgi:hypothetical protein
VDTAGVGKQVVMWLAQNRAAPPKWDHSGFVIDKSEQGACECYTINQKHID